MATRQKVKTKIEAGHEYSHLTAKDIEMEIDQQRYALCWEGLDMDTWVGVIKLFCIRFAYMMAYVHFKKHADEIHQGKEIAYKLLYG